MMTYEEFRAHCLAAQLAYIARERERMNALAGVLVKHGIGRVYATAAKKMGLHPLTAIEIINRRRELDGMEKGSKQTNDDHALIRVAYELYQDRHATPSSGA